MVSRWDRGNSVEYEYSHFLRRPNPDMLAVCREIDDMLIELGTTTETTRLRINANKTVSHLGSEIDAEIGTVYYDLLCKIRDELRDLVNDDSYVLDDE